MMEKFKTFQKYLHYRINILRAISTQTNAKNPLIEKKTCHINLRFLCIFVRFRTIVLCCPSVKTFLEKFFKVKVKILL